MIIYCLRHGEAEHNLLHLMNEDPSKQIHLTDLGRRQIEASALTIKNVPLEVIFTSEFPRAIETARIINRQHNVPIIQDKRLNDLVSGVEGQTYHSYKEQIKRTAEKQGIDPDYVRLNNGESFEDERQRVCTFLDEIRTQGYGQVLISAHFDTVCIIQRYARGPTNRKHEDFKPQKGKIYRFKV